MSFSHNDIPIVRFSDFIGIGYFGDENQNIISPIFDSRQRAQLSWKRIMGVEEDMPPLLHVVFVEHFNKYEFIAYPQHLNPNQINYIVYRSFSSLESLYKFKKNYNARTFVKFGWHDMTKKNQFDVPQEFAIVDSVEFKKTEEIEEGSLLYKIQKNQG